MNQKYLDDTIKQLESDTSNYRTRTIPFTNGFLKIFYVKSLIDGVSLRECIIKPVVQHATEATDVKARFVMDKIIYAEECRVETDLSLIEDILLDGMLVLLFSADREYLVVDIKKVAQRSVVEPKLQYTLHSPLDCFVENLDTNLSLLRYRIKDKNIHIETVVVGERSKTKVVIAYIDDIANPNTMKKIVERIKAIKIDSIFDSGEIHSFIKDKNLLFPQAGIVERSDLAAEALMEGKAIILVDGSYLALKAPKVMPEFLYSCDDRYDNKYYGMFMRIIRYIALFISYTASSFYIGIEMYHHDVLPADYILSLSQMRSKVPFSAIIGVLLLEFIVELIREALLRVPVQIGQAIGIVGAIIIGQAAISAGIFTPVLLILVSLELLASFAMPDFTLSNSFRILKLFIIAMTGILGFYGFTLAQIFIIIKLVSTDTFGVPYMAPFAPRNLYDVKRAFIFNRTNSKKRQTYIRPNDPTRAPK